MKHILILGAASDVAKALAHKYAKYGHSLILAARRHERLSDMVGDIKIRFNIAIETVEFDALDYVSHADFYEGLSHKPDIAITVFGYLGSQELAHKDLQETEKTIHSNYTGAVSILNIIANDFESRKSGTIIGISSVAGERGRKSNYIYGSAKAGFTAYLSGLRNRLHGSGVHVLTVLPGFMKTAMTEGMNLPELLTANPEQAANDIYEACESKRNVIYILKRWRVVMFIIKSIPEFIFKRLSI